MVRKWRWLMWDLAYLLRILQDFLRFLWNFEPRPKWGRMMKMTRVMPTKFPSYPLLGPFPKTGKVGTVPVDERIQFVEGNHWVVPGVMLRWFWSIFIEPRLG